jgi:hypothetical protein
MTHPALRRPLALVVAAALFATACGDPAPTASPTPNPTAAPTSAPPTSSPAASAAASPLSSGAVDALFDTIESQVVAVRGLPATNVKRETIDAAALKTFNAKSFDEDNPPEYIAANERMYKAFGLMPEDQSLRKTFLDLIDSQVAGFYRPTDKTLYVVSRTGSINGADKITFAHEYDHALQDANFAVFKDQKTLLDESDQALARAAIYEGDATLLMAMWAGANLSAAEFADVQAAGSDPEALAILARTPQVLVEGLLFPYTAGQAFVLPIQQSSSWKAVDALYDDMPLSTEQILHPDKYRAGEKPVAVKMPATLAADMGKGWNEAIQDTFGEFQLGVWLRESGVRASDAAAAAAGWGGDRLAVLDGPSGAWAVVLRSTWDSTDDAKAFQQAAGQAVADGPTAGTVLVKGRDVTVVFGSGGAILDRAASVAGFASAR